MRFIDTSEPFRICCSLLLAWLTVAGLSGCAYPSHVADRLDIEKAPTFTFERTDWINIGNGVGSVQAGDMDNDGDLDIVGVGGRNIYVIENTGDDPETWPLHGSLDSTLASGLNGSELFDVDRDGDLDIVGAKYRSSLGWWENPGERFGDGSGAKNPAEPASRRWAFHSLSRDFDGWYLHDLIRADLDRDGKSEEFVATLTQRYWNGHFHVYWFRPLAEPRNDWEQHAITHDQPGPNNNHAGLDAGDIDGDGDIDISFSNGWFESPGSPGATWIWHGVTDIYGVSNSLIRDMDADGDQDLVISAGHHGQGVYWLENTGTPRKNSWIRHNVSAVRGDATRRHVYSDPEDGRDHLHHPECLQVADLDGDGDFDIVTCDLFFGEDDAEPGWDEPVHNIYVYENVEKNPQRWRRENISPNSWPSHLLYLVDMNRDGKWDIITEAPKINSISYLENTTTDD